MHIYKNFREMDHNCFLWNRGIQSSHIQFRKGINTLHPNSTGNEKDYAFPTTNCILSSMSILPVPYYDLVCDCGSVNCGKERGHS